MTEISPAINRDGRTDESLRAAWGAGFEVAVCERCQWRCLASGDFAQQICPNCHTSKLTVLPGGLNEMPYSTAPELLLPFQLDQRGLGKAIGVFSAGIPFPPAGLNQAAMLSRMMKVYLPVWLVDAQVSARWETEAGFDYQVISHQDHFDQDAKGWQSQEIKEDRVRWENRVGLLNRVYQNITAPAIDDHQRIDAQLGPFRQDSALPYEPNQTAGAYIRLPDNPPKEAWPEATASFEKTAAAECARACGAGHTRQFRWKAEYSNLNWTMMLLPVFSTCYVDDQGHAQAVLINGQTGRITGTRRSSMKRAGKWSLSILVASLLFFSLGLLVDLFLAAGYPPLTGFSTLILILGFLGVFASAIPYLTAWDYNRKQGARPPGKH